MFALLVLTTLLQIACVAQRLYVVHALSSANSATTKLLQDVPKFADGDIELQKTVQGLLNKLWATGYLAAGVDSTHRSADTARIYYFVGEHYKWAKVTASPVMKRVEQATDFSAAVFDGKPVSAQQFAAACDQLLRYYEQHGYPFAKVQLDSINISTNTVQALIKVQPGALTKIDSINIEGDVAISLGFLCQHLNIHKGDLYNEKNILDISRKIKELSFLQESKPWMMSFALDKNILSLYLEEKNANNADIIVGLAPSNSTVGNRFFLTGDVRLHLVNSLHSGEQLSLTWQNLQYKSPRFNLEATIPYVGGTAFGATGKFNYIKLDSTFTTVNAELGVLYHLGTRSQLKLYWSTFTSRLIRADTQYVRVQRRLPYNLDYNLRSYGILYSFSNLDRTINTRKGLYMSINSTIGARKTVRNKQIEDLYDDVRFENFSYLYDTVSPATIRIMAQSQIQYYVPLRKALSLKCALYSAYLAAPRVMRNDLFQIGGYRLLRGFDEASLFTDRYAIATIEPRYALTKTSYVFGLIDAGIVHLPLNPARQKSAFGFGGGLSLLGKNGIFNLIYAFGNSSGNGIQFKDSKIHFGYINQF
jgi:outer membrane protein assembly factor BamA